MSGFRLIILSDNQSFELLPGRSYTVGRAVVSDISLYDPTVSRNHAELTVADGGVSLKDLGSSNGTFVNGRRVATAVITPEDSVTFGKVACAVQPVARQQLEDFAAAQAGGTIVRQVSVEPRPSMAEALGPGESPDDPGRTRKLELLLDVSQSLSGEYDPAKLLTRVVDMTFEVMRVDRAALLLVDETRGELVTRVSRSRLGDLTAKVPSSIARKAVEQRVAVITDNAAADARFKGKSVVLQSVRGAMCAPLMAEQEKVLGLLYVDNVSTTEAFSDDDLQFLIAFSGIAAVAINKVRYAERIRREANVRANFERYFAPNVAATIAGQQEQVRPGGERRNLTVMFADIRGFTSLAEGMEPDVIATMLSDYFTEMVDIIFEHGGTLDKFMGDAVMALWGAPLAREGDPQRALDAALAMQRAVAGLNEAWRDTGKPELKIGIGINYGEAFAGNIGSQRRLEYTAIGDTVNVASRLCSRAAPGQVVFSEPFYRMLDKPPEVERIDAIELRGRSQPVPIYLVKS